MTEQNLEPEPEEEEEDMEDDVMVGGPRTHFRLEFVEPEAIGYGP